MKLIPLSQNSKTIAGKYFAMVDDEDYELVSRFKWRVAIRRGTDFRAIKHKTKDSPFYSLHRLILNITDTSILVDHKDRNPLNNRKSNLRICNSIESATNISSAKNSSSKYLGVSFSLREIKRNGKVYVSPAWRALINKNYKRFHLGWFKNELDAAKAYNEAAIELHGEFANLNKI